MLCQLKFSNIWGYLHELKKSKKNSKINNLHADSYDTEKLPYRIFEDYYKNFLRFKMFKIIKNDNYKYLIGIINKDFGMEIYQVLNYWHIEVEKITYKKTFFILHFWNKNFKKNLIHFSCIT